jgi:hypothetical protein
MWRQPEVSFRLRCFRCPRKTVSESVAVTVTFAYYICGDDLDKEPAPQAQDTICHPQTPFSFTPGMGHQSRWQPDHPIQPTIVDGGQIYVPNYNGGVDLYGLTPQPAP